MATSRIPILVVLLSTLLLAAGCTTGSADAQATAVGWMGPLTGDAASYGEAIRNGVELAQNNSEQPLRVIYEDSKCDGREAASAMTKLATVDGVDAVIGEVCSGATLAAAPIAATNQVVMVSASSTSPDLSDNQWVFRTIPSDALQGEFAAQLISEDGHETLAILHGNEEYGVGLADTLEETFSGEVVAREAFTRGSVDMRTQLTKINSENPDALYIVSNSPDSAIAALTQAQELGLDVAVYGSEGLKSEDVTAGAGSAADGLVVSSVSSGSEEFAQAHQEHFGSAPGPFAAQAYDAYTALERAYATGASSGEELRQALVDMEFSGASGEIDFDENGDVSGNYEVFVVEDGSFAARE